MRRGKTLVHMQNAGTISGLRFQVKFDLEINGVTLYDHKGKPMTYTPDAMYTRDGVDTFEDSKAGDFIEDLSKLKIAIFEIQKSTKVLIPKT